MKTYLLISPQPWGKMYLSKHNYAMELAENGNQVYFLNPPSYKKFSASPELEVNEERQNLFLINYTLPSTVYTLRFKARPVHDLYLRRTLVKQLNRLAQFDELWCFEPNIFSDLKTFNATKKLLFIVDYHDNSALKKVVTDVDGIASISKHILDYFEFTDKPKILLHHGLNKNFSAIAMKKIAEGLAYAAPLSIQVAYVGNLLQGDRVDMNTLRLIVEQNRGVTFHFYGPYEEKANSLGATINDKLRNFVEFLKAAKNVRLHGVKDQLALAKEIQQMDVLLTCYNYLTDYNKSSNCHKVIEYLSTGRAVVANRLFAYDGLRELVEMPNELTNENLPMLFKKVIGNLTFYNSPARQKARIAFALENTYKEHINTLQDFLSSADAFTNVYKTS